MTRRSWIVNPKPPHNLIPIEEYQREEKAGYHIMPDLPDVVSPIDGTVIRGRKGYREHCKRYNVTNASDFKETWKQQAKARASLFRDKESKAQRIEALKNAYDKHMRRK